MSLKMASMASMSICKKISRLYHAMTSDRTRRRQAKLLFLRLCKFFFVFDIAKRLTKNKLRIICLHGFSVGDECLWSGGIMMHPETLNLRLEYLKRNGYSILTLSEAIPKLRNRMLPPYSVVITIDDGFATTYSLARPVFKKYDIPYTIYQTTYYCDKDLPVVNLILQYAFWKTKKKHICFDFIDDGYEYIIHNPHDNRDIISKLSFYIDNLSCLKKRKYVLHYIFTILELDADEIIKSDCFRLINTAQAQELREDGVEFQLHTHRHRFPAHEKEAEEELRANREWIVSATGCNPVHLCYPSNQYHLSLLDFLRRFGISSATTCIPGLNDAATEPLLLHRFLDDDKIHPLVFEAHLTGTIFLLRNCARKMTLFLQKVKGTMQRIFSI